MLPCSDGSSTPVKVTSDAARQLAAVYMSEAGATVPSVRSFDDSPIVTFAVGWLVRFSVIVAVPPASVFVLPLLDALPISATSLSVFVTDTSDGFRLL